MNAVGALAPMNQNNAAAIPNIIAMRVPEAGSPFAPWPCDLAGAATAGLAADVAGAADSLGGGGGQVILPSLITVVPRITSSSMLTLMVPSLVLHNSSVRRNRLVA